MTRSRSDFLPQPLPERSAQEIQRTRTVLAEVRHALEDHVARLKDLETSLALLVEGPPPGLAVRLTPREREVLRLVAQGYTDAAIGQHLGRKQGTIQVHIQHIHTKLGTRTRPMAVLRAWQLGLI